MGFPFIPTPIGLFAVAEVFAGIGRIVNGQEHSNEKIARALPGAGGAPDC